MSLKLITAPTDYPATVAEVKVQCRVDGNSEDALLTTYLAAAVAHIESVTGRAIMPQTWELSLDDFSDSIMLERGPVSAITSVKYTDTDDVEQTVSSTNYTLDDASDPQWLVKASDYSWPQVAEGVNNVRIRFVAGYSDVPEEIKAACLILTAHFYDNRSSGEIPEVVDRLLVNHRAF